MKTETVNLKRIRTAAAAKGDFSIAAIARRVQVSRWTIYHLPRCGRALKKIKETYHV